MCSLPPFIKSLRTLDLLSPTQYCICCILAVLYEHRLPSVGPLIKVNCINCIIPSAIFRVSLSEPYTGRKILLACLHGCLRTYVFRNRILALLIRKLRKVVNVRVCIIRKISSQERETLLHAIRKNTADQLRQLRSVNSDLLGKTPQIN